MVASQYASAMLVSKRMGVATLGWWIVEDVGRCINTSLDCAGMPDPSQGIILIPPY